MIRSRGTSYVVAALTLWPLLYLVGFTVWTLSFFVSGRVPTPGTGTVPTWFLVVGVLHVLTMLLGLALLAVYVVDVVRNPRLEGTDMRTVWVLLVVLVAPGAMPVYWWLHLRPGSESFRARLAPAVR